MLFHISHKYKAGFTHEDQKKMLEVFADFEFPAGYEIKWHVFSPDGRMFSLVEAPSVEVVFEVVAHWSGVLLDYEVLPVVDIEATVPILEKAIAAREA